MFLAFIVVFRVFFALIYVCQWKWRYNFNEKYQIKNYNLEQAYSKLRKKAKVEEESSDDQEIYETAR